MQVSSWCLLLICFVIFTSPSRVLASLTLTLDKCQYRPRLSARPALLASRVSASLRYRGSEIINTLEMTVLLMSGMLGSGLWCVVTDKWTSMLQFYPKRFIMWLSFIHSLTLMAANVLRGGVRSAPSSRPCDELTAGFTSSVGSLLAARSCLCVVLNFLLHIFPFWWCLFMLLHCNQVSCWWECFNGRLAQRPSMLFFPDWLNFSNHR